jgi:hypothetical protein
MKQETLQQMPDWATAPEWAQWFAIDGDGEGFWYAKEPFKGDLWYLPNGYVFAPCGNFDPTNWRTSLQQRPQTESK